MTISIHASAFDVNSWYQKITLTCSAAKFFALGCVTFCIPIMTH